MRSPLPAAAALFFGLALIANHAAATTGDADPDAPPTEPLPIAVEPPASPPPPLPTKPSQDRAMVRVEIHDCIDYRAILGDLRPLRPMRYAGDEHPFRPAAEPDILVLDFDGDRQEIRDPRKGTIERRTVVTTPGTHHVYVSRLGCVPEEATVDLKPGYNKILVQLEGRFGTKVSLFFEPVVGPFQLGLGYEHLASGAAFREGGRSVTAPSGADLFGLIASYEAAVSFIEFGLLRFRVSRGTPALLKEDGSAVSGDLYRWQFAPSVGLRFPLGWFAPRIGIAGGMGGYVLTGDTKLPKAGLKGVYNVYTGLDFAWTCGIGFRLEGGYAGVGGPNGDTDAVPGGFYASAQVAFTTSDIQRKQCGVYVNPYEKR